MTIVCAVCFRCVYLIDMNRSQNNQRVELLRYSGHAMSSLSLDYTLIVYGIGCL